MPDDVQAFLTGIFPRSEALVSATRDLDRKRISPEQCEAVRLEDATAVIELQRKSGFTSLTDGLLNWQDIFRPIVDSCPGFESGALTRWFDNNTFYRRPEIVGELSLDGGPGREYFRTRLVQGQGAWKVILPGPYTFARVADDRHYKSKAERMDAIAGLLRKVARWCIERGATHIQFSEPWFVYQPVPREDLEAAAAAYEKLCKGLRAQTVLHTYFGNLKSIFPDVLDFRVDGIGVDLTATNLEDLRTHSFDKGLVLGVVDGRNSLVETPEGIRAAVRDAQDQLDPEWIGVGPSCELELCPRSVAEAKVESLGKAVKAGGRSS